MSRLTIQLLNRAAPSLRRQNRWHPVFASIARRLKSAYGVPTLGNHRNPVWEIFFIALSARTADIQFRRTFRALRTRFPTLRELAETGESKILPYLAAGGLANKRAGQMRGIARRLLTDFGDRPGPGLRKLTTAEAFAYLTNLPGVGPKSALCVMMYSLHRDVFPVDIHVQRIAARIGAIRAGLKHYQAQAVLPGLIPDGISRDLHIDLVVHGRRICTPRRPQCAICPLNDLCRTGRHALGADREGSHVQNRSHAIA